MAAVGLSQGVLANLLALQKTTDQINNVQNQLATGKKVNTALDNPTNFFLANSFQTSINTLNDRLDKIAVAQRTLESANTGLTNLTTLLQSAQGSLNQALASAPTTAVVTGNQTAVSGVTITSTTLLSSIGFAATDVITVSDGTANVVNFTTAAGTTIQSLLNAINGSTTSRARVELAGDGRLLLEAAGATYSLSITTNSGSTTVLNNLGFNNNTNNGALNNTAASTGLTSAARTSLAAQFEVLRTQIDQIAADSSFNGVSLLINQSLTVIMNQSATTKLVVAGNNDTSTGLGVVASQNAFQDNYDVNVAITNINTALNTLRNQASTYTANVAVIQDRTEFTKQTINTLQTGINDLTLADANQEGASLLALQTRQSLSSTALSLATQADQNVLRLFR